MATWTKLEIRKKIRQVTGRLSANEISDSELDDRINKFYQYTFPAEVKLERIHTYFEFLTTPYESFYVVPDTYINFENPAYINNIEISYFQNPDNFYKSLLQNIQQDIPWTGDGVTFAFSTTLAANTIFPGTLIITDNVETFSDINTTYTTANVTWTGSLGGTATINYATGSVSVSFNTAPISGSPIMLSYGEMSAGTPRSVLYYNNLFQLAPVPDTVYRFKMKAYEKLLPLVNTTDRPLLDQWGPCIAYGTARDLCVDYGEMDSYSDISVLYKEQVSYCIDRTLQDLLNERAMPNF